MLGLRWSRRTHRRLGSIHSPLEAIMLGLVLVQKYRAEDPTLCETCEDPLHSLTGDRCPECGMPFDPDVVAAAARTKEPTS